MDKRILFGTLISNRQWILPYYLNCLQRLDYPKKLIDIYWIINNNHDQGELLLREFQNTYKNEYHSIQIELYNNPKIPEDKRSSNIRSLVYPWLGELRNRLLNETIRLDCTHLWSHDSDILFKQDVLNRLLSHDLPIVSALLYNGYKYTSFDRAFEYPNILREISPRSYEHIKNFKTKNPGKIPVGTLLENDFTGASILIRQDVCKVARYSANEFGEDEPFCYSARQAGYKLFCDISVYMQHVMAPEFLEQFKDF